MALLVATVLLAGCDGQEHQATAVLETGAEVTMTVQALVGIHSDWTRRLTVRSSEGEVSQALLPDHGGWDGSDLFRDATGIHVLRKGDRTCLAFRIDPPAFVPAPDGVCGGDASPPPGFEIIGRFEETPRSAWPIGFIRPDTGPGTP